MSEDPDLTNLLLGLKTCLLAQQLDVSRSEILHDLFLITDLSLFLTKLLIVCRDMIVKVL